MRLFRKVYVRVLSGILVVAVAIPGYLLWEVEKQSLRDVCRCIKLFENIKYRLLRNRHIHILSF